MNSDITPNTETDDQPSPEQENIIRKVKIAIGIMSLILILGFGAFVVAVIIKLGETDKKSTQHGALELPQTGCTLDIATTATIIDSSLSGEQLLIIVQNGAQRQALIFSIASCRTLTRINLGQSASTSR